MINLTFDIEVVYLCNLEWVSALFFFIIIYIKMSAELIYYSIKKCLCVCVYIYIIYNICENHSIHTHMRILLL